MSTRASIIYDYHLHLYREVISGEVCLQADPVVWTDEAANEWGSHLNCKYGDIVVPREKLVMWRDALTSFLEERPIVTPPAT